MSLGLAPTTVTAQTATIQPNTTLTGTEPNRKAIRPAKAAQTDTITTIAYNYEPMAESIWKRTIDDYLNSYNPNPAQRFIQRTPPTPASPEQIRELFLALAPLSQERLQTLLDRQPPTSSLLPFLHLVLGDRAAIAGDEEKAQSLWQKAAQAPIVSDEAMRRITNIPDSNDTPLIAGLMLPLTGQSSGLSNNLIMAARKALADYRDVNIHLEVTDSGNTPETAKTAVQSLISRGSQIIIGPIFHPEALAAASEASAQDIPILTLNPRRDILLKPGITFTNAFLPAAQARIMARYAINEAGLTRLAILAPDTDYGRLLAKTFTEEVSLLGGTITHSVLFPEDETDFSIAIKMLVHLAPNDVTARLASGQEQPPAHSEKELKPQIDFDALFLPTSAKQAQMIAPQAIQFNILATNTTLLGVSLWNRTKLLNESKALVGSLFCDINQNLRDQFNTAYQKTLGVAPIPALSMLTYDSVAILAQLLRDQRLGGDAWRSGLTREIGFYGSAGAVRFLENGISERFYHLYQIEEKQIVFLPSLPQNGTQDPTQAAILTPEESTQPETDTNILMPNESLGVESDYNSRY